MKSNIYHENYGHFLSKNLFWNFVIFVVIISFHWQTESKQEPGLKYNRIRLSMNFKMNCQNYIHFLQSEVLKFSQEIEHLTFEIENLKRKVNNQNQNVSSVITWLKHPDFIVNVYTMNTTHWIQFTSTHYPCVSIQILASVDALYQLL